MPTRSPTNKTKPIKPGREGTKREATQAEVDARKKAMYDARMEAHKKNKTGPFRVIPGRQKKMGGGLMEATQRLRRQGLKRGGGVCVRGLNRDAVGKNS